jgi:hypothetical protein
MTAPQAEFIALIEATVNLQRYSGDWLHNAMKVVHLIPDIYKPEAASLVFCRWLFGEDAHVRDVLMLRMLSTRQ